MKKINNSCYIKNKMWWDVTSTTFLNSALASSVQEAWRTGTLKSTNAEQSREARTALTAYCDTLSITIKNLYDDTFIAVLNFLSLASALVILHSNIRCYCRPMQK